MIRAISIDWSLDAEPLLSCKDKAGTLPDDADVFA
jgi:dTDP-4-dehydrorhamnose 3,5-epimerase-like enzyme